MCGVDIRLSERLDHDSCATVLCFKSRYVEFIFEHNKWKRKVCENIMGHLRTPQIVENCTELNKVSIWWSYESLRFSELFVLNFCCFALYTSWRGRLFYEMFYWNRVLIQSVKLDTSNRNVILCVFFCIRVRFCGWILKIFS